MGKITGKTTLAEVQKICDSMKDCRSCICASNGYCQYSAGCMPMDWDLPAEQPDQSAKHDAGKIRPTLVLPGLIQAVSLVREYEILHGVKRDIFMINDAFQYAFLDYVFHPEKESSNGYRYARLCDLARCVEILIESQRSGSADSDWLRGKTTPFPSLIRAVAAVREYGIQTYTDPENWRRVSPERYRDALCRHGLAYLDNPDSVDDESGLSHLWHIACNIMFLIELEEN